MKKRVLMLLGAAVMALSLGACKDKKSSEPEQQQNVQQTFTVAFEVDGTRVATARVKDGEKVTDEIAIPTKAGYTFVGWYEGDTLVDLATYVVTHNVTLTAHFEEIHIPEYNIEETKDPDKTYYLVVGWWECTTINADGTQKLTSFLTPETVRLFYHNLRNYLKTVGATDENLAAITFRNYSSGPIADMGAMVNSDQDVDLLIGVGNAVNSTGNVNLYNGSNDYKFATEMGDPLTSRYVACTTYATQRGVETYEWLKETTAGRNSFKKLLTQDEINASVTVDLTVTVHGDTDAVTHLEDKDTPVTMPTITVPEDKVFKGFATTNGGAVALNVAKDAVLKFADLKNLIVEGAKTLDLYPVLDDKEVINLTVTVHGDTDAVTLLTDRDTPLTMPEITVPEGKLFKGFSLTNGGAVALNVAKNATIKYGDLETLLAENQTTMDLYPVLDDAPTQDKTCKVYIQVNGSNLTEPEAKLLEARFKSTLAEDESIDFEIINKKAADFKSDVLTAGDGDVIIGGSNPVSSTNFTAHADGGFADSGAKHFANTRKVVILNSVNPRHLDFAKKFYNFVVAEAVQYTIHATFWQKADKSWVSDDEKAAMITGMTSNLNTYLSITGTDTLESKYNVTFANDSVTTNTANGVDKVADLAAATLALREGAGTDLIIGCGSNIDEQTGLTNVEKKKISNDDHTFVTHSTRYAAIPSPTNPLARNIFDTYFVFPTV